MMDFVYQTFPEARGQAPQDTVPLLPGMQHGDVPTTASLKRAQPINVLMLQASDAFARANELTKPSFVKYPAKRYYISYRTSSDEDRDRPAKVNLELLLHMTVRSESCVSFSQQEMMCLEQALLSSWDTQNLLF